MDLHMIGMGSRRASGNMDGLLHGSGLEHAIFLVLVVFEKD